ncbi:AraC family transcriptional regulator [Phragmitibacter flavus]|nr:AraC family transcriptional regulator [Phragmitibacter flavus]
MKALYQGLDPRTSTEVVMCEHIHGNDFDCPWHFHEEMEIMLVISGGTQRCIGDNFSPLTPGDLVVVGPNLLHGYSNEYPEGQPRKPVEAISVKFNPSLLGSWLQMSDVMQLQNFFRQAANGIQVRGSTRKRVAERMPLLLKTQGLQRLILLLEILNELSTSNDLSQIASAGFSLESPPVDHGRLSRITRFIKKRIGEPLYLKDVAKHVGMSPVTLSRYLRSHLRKTFPTYLNELRIARVCRLLKETDATVSEIAVHCGFDSMANFERQFRKLQGCSPKVYRQRSHRVSSPVLPSSSSNHRQTATTSTSPNSNHLWQAQPNKTVQTAFMAM